MSFRNDDAALADKPMSAEYLYREAVQVNHVAGRRCRNHQALKNRADFLARDLEQGLVDFKEVWADLIQNEELWENAICSRR